MKSRAWSGFTLDLAFLDGSVDCAKLPLCEVRLQLDARFPWLILIPRVAGAREVEDLSPGDRAALVEEVVAAGRAVRAVGEALGRPVFKLNIATLGNVTPQLHVHIVGRRPDDAAWPDPVWGSGAAEAYDPPGLRTLRSVAMATLSG